MLKDFLLAMCIDVAVFVIVAILFKVFPQISAFLGKIDDFLIEFWRS